MTITEIVKGAYHTIISDESLLADAMDELNLFLKNCKINGDRIIEIDGANKMIVFYNAQ